MSLKQRFEGYLFFLALCILVWSYPLDISAAVQRLVPVVISKLPHDRSAYTQGLAIEEDELYESTGLYGQSSVRHLDILTGKVLKKLSLSPKVFGEGLAVFPQQIIQITWKEEQALVYERPSLKLQQILFYSGEGWGLCRDDKTMWMSNGTSTITQRDLQTFKVLKALSVQFEGSPIRYLNDLECVGNDLYANIWQTNEIIRIDKMTGEVTGVIDAFSLLSPQERANLSPGEVLNGIAFRPKTETFFLTGKNWPWIFEVRLMPESL